MISRRFFFILLFPLHFRSFGCILYELAELKIAFNGMALGPIFQAVVVNPIPQITDAYLNSILRK
jgi:hypothetical protein